MNWCWFVQARTPICSGSKFFFVFFRRSVCERDSLSQHPLDPHPVLKAIGPGRKHRIVGRQAHAVGTGSVDVQFRRNARSAQRKVIRHAVVRGDRTVVIRMKRGSAASGTPGAACVEVVAARCPPAEKPQMPTRDGSTPSEPACARTYRIARCASMSGD